MTGLTYPYTKYDRILGDNLADDLELNPKVTPPSGTAGGAGRYKYWADTTNPLGASLRQVSAERATAGFYVAAEWITWGTIDVINRKIHLNTDFVDFTEGTGPLVVHALTVTGATSLNTLTVSGAASFLNNVTIAGTLTAGATTLSSLTVTGATSLANTNVTGSLTVSGNITGGNLITSGNISGVGLNLTGGATVGGNLHVVGTTQLDGALTASGGITTTGLTVNGNENVTGILTAGSASITAGLTVGGNLHVLGNTDLDGTLNVDGATTLSNLTVTGTLTLPSGTLSVPTVNATKYQLSGVDFATRITDAGASGGGYHAVHGYTGLPSIHLAANDSIYTADVTTWRHRSGWGVFPPFSGLMYLDYTGLHVSALVVAETFSIHDAGVDYPFASVGPDLALGAIATIIVGPEYASTNSSRIGIYNTGQTYNKAAEHNFWSLTSGATFAVFNSGGTANVTGSWNIICDDSVKENVTPYSPGLAELLQLNPVSYNYIIPPAADPQARWSPFAKTMMEGETEPPIRYGLMASNVLSVIPEMVTEMVFSDIPEGIPSTPLATIAPTHLLWLLINAAKELSGTDDALNDRIAAVEADLGDNPPYAPINSPALTGVPTAPTAAYNTSTTQLATTAFVRTGTNTNDSASAGQVGEFQSAQVLSTAGIALTSGVDTSVTTLSLTAGDWDIYASVGFTLNNPNNMLLRGWVNPTGAATAPSVDQMGGHAMETVANSSTTVIMPVTTMRISLSATTSIRLGATATGGGTAAGWGKLMARRVR